MRGNIDAFVSDYVWDALQHHVEYPFTNCEKDFVKFYVANSARDSVKDCVMDSVKDSARQSVNFSIDDHV